MKIRIEPKLQSMLLQVFDDECEPEPALRTALMRLAFSEPLTGTEAAREIQRAVDTDTLEAALRLSGPQQERRAAADVAKLLDEIVGRMVKLLARSAWVRHVRTNPKAMNAREIAWAYGARGMNELMAEMRTNRDEDRGTEDI